MEGLNGYLVLPTILGPVGFMLERQVMLDRPARISDFLISPRRQSGNDMPERCKNWKKEQYSEEHRSLESTTKLPGKVVWDPN